MKITEMTEEEIAKIINTVEQGVSLSWVGEVFSYGGTPEKPQKQVNQVAYQVFLTVLTSLLNKVEAVDIVHRPPPSVLEQ